MTELFSAEHRTFLRLFVCLLNLGFTSNKLVFFPWRNGEDAGLVIQGSVVRALAQELKFDNVMAKIILF